MFIKGRTSGFEDQVERKSMLIRFKGRASGVEQPSGKEVNVNSVKGRTSGFEDQVERKSMFIKGRTSGFEDQV